ncbi:MAG: type III pantothenate kinase [Clostridiales bacterium]|nr:type III pantothenate kinase [Clostridiales bacterium]
MILAVDIGNTNIVLGCLDGNTVCGTARLATAPRRTEHEYAAFIRQVFDFSDQFYTDFDGAIVSSVVPPLTYVLCEAIRMLTGHTPLVVGAGVKTGLNIRIDNPAQLGSDLVATAVAAAADYPTPAVIIDMGTATTITVLDGAGDFLGGAIIPGLSVSLTALASNTSQLPRIPIEAPKHVIGTNTIACMQSGAVFGAASMLDGMIDRIEDELGRPASIIATGGLSGSVIPYCRHEIKLDDTLLLRGLGKIYEKNRRDAAHRRSR